LIAGVFAPGLIQNLTALFNEVLVGGIERLYVVFLDLRRQYYLILSARNHLNFRHPITVGHATSDIPRSVLRNLANLKSGIGNRCFSDVFVKVSNLNGPLFVTWSQCCGNQAAFISLFTGLFSINFQHLFMVKKPGSVKTVLKIMVIGSQSSTKFLLQYFDIRLNKPGFICRVFYRPWRCH